MRNRAIGVESPPQVLEVEKGAIIRFAQAIGDPNPMWNDESEARRSAANLPALRSRNPSRPSLSHALRAYAGRRQRLGVLRAGQAGRRDYHRGPYREHERTKRTPGTHGLHSPQDNVYEPVRTGGGHPAKHPHQVLEGTRLISEV
ncbi:MAG: MaoC family dehydratase N-terminal domain-containing protein [Dehalococcoidia bacterium]|nr:MaoC family dehydratase N-terminal domain-containing protein [Dehalococcoidia bacterium]